MQGRIEHALQVTYTNEDEEFQQEDGVREVQLPIDDEQRVEPDNSLRNSRSRMTGDNNTELSPRVPLLALSRHLKNTLPNNATSNTNGTSNGSNTGEEVVQVFRLGQKKLNSSNKFNKVKPQQLQQPQQVQPQQEDLAKKNRIMEKVHMHALKHMHSAPDDLLLSSASASASSHNSHYYAGNFTDRSSSSSSSSSSGSSSRFSSSSSSSSISSPSTILKFAHDDSDGEHSSDDDSYMSDNSCYNSRDNSRNNSPRGSKDVSYESDSDSYESDCEGINSSNNNGNDSKISKYILKYTSKKKKLSERGNSQVSSEKLKRVSEKLRLKDRSASVPSHQSKKLKKSRDLKKSNDGNSMSSHESLSRRNSSSNLKNMTNSNNEEVPSPVRVPAKTFVCEEDEFGYSDSNNATESRANARNMHLTIDKCFSPFNEEFCLLPYDHFLGINKLNQKCEIVISVLTLPNPRDSASSAPSSNASASQYYPFNGVPSALRLGDSYTAFSMDQYENRQFTIHELFLKRGTSFASRVRHFLNSHSPNHQFIYVNNNNNNFNNNSNATINTSSSNLQMTKKFQQQLAEIDANNSLNIKGLKVAVVYVDKNTREKIQKATSSTSGFECSSSSSSTSSSSSSLSTSSFNSTASSSSIESVDPTQSQEAEIQEPQPADTQQAEIPKSFWNFMDYMGKRVLVKDLHYRGDFGNGVDDQECYAKEWTPPSPPSSPSSSPSSSPPSSPTSPISIVYHASPLLSPDQFRKLIGNDICMIVYYNCTDPFDGSLLDSLGKMPQVFAIVTPTSTKDDTLYKISFIRRSSIHKFGPQQPPSNTVFNITEPVLRDLLLCKMHNGMLMAKRCPPLNRLYSTPRAAYINDLAKSFNTNNNNSNNN